MYGSKNSRDLSRPLSAIRGQGLCVPEGMGYNGLVGKAPSGPPWNGIFGRLWPEMAIKGLNILPIDLTQLDSDKLKPRTSIILSAWGGRR